MSVALIDHNKKQHGELVSNAKLFGEEIFNNIFIEGHQVKDLNLLNMPCRGALSNNPHLKHGALTFAADILSLLFTALPIKFSTKSKMDEEIKNHIENSDNPKDELYKLLPYDNHELWTDVYIYTSSTSGLMMPLYQEFFQRLMESVNRNTNALITTEFINDVLTWIHDNKPELLKEQINGHTVAHVYAATYNIYHDIKISDENYLFLVDNYGKTVMHNYINNDVRYFNESFMEKVSDFREGNAVVHDLAIHGLLSDSEVKKYDYLKNYRGNTPYDLEPKNKCPSNKRSSYEELADWIKEKQKEDLQTKKGGGTITI